MRSLDSGPTRALDSSQGPMTTQDILDATTINLSCTLKPSDQLPKDIFDNSALYPSRLSNTILPLGSLERLSPKTTPTKTQNPGDRTPVKNDNFGASEDGSADANQLLLSRTQIRSILLYSHLKASRIPI